MRYREGNICDDSSWRTSHPGSNSFILWVGGSRVRCCMRCMYIITPIYSLHSVTYIHIIWKLILAWVFWLETHWNGDHNLYNWWVEQALLVVSTGWFCWKWHSHQYWTILLRNYTQYIECSSYRTSHDAHVTWFLIAVYVYVCKSAV